MYSWSLFLEDCVKISRETIEETSSFQRLIGLLSEVPRSDARLSEGFNDLRNRDGSGYRAEVVHNGRYCRVMLIFLPENASVGLHNHPGQHGLIYCFDGAVEVDAYDEVSSTLTEARLNMVYSKTIHRGECATLTPVKGNVHRLIAVENSLLIDVFLPPLKVENHNKCKRFVLKESVAEGDSYNAVVVSKPQS